MSIVHSYNLRLTASFEKIYLNPSPVQIEMDDKKNQQQYAVRDVYPAEQDIHIYTCISLTETGYCLDKHEEKENGIYDLQEVLLHGSKLYCSTTDCQPQLDSLISYRVIGYKRCCDRFYVERLDR